VVAESQKQMMHEMSKTLVHKDAVALGGQLILLLVEPRAPSKNGLRHLEDPVLDVCVREPSHGPTERRAAKNGAGASSIADSAIRQFMLGVQLMLGLVREYGVLTLAFVKQLQTRADDGHGWSVGTRDDQGCMNKY
jgi:hypothetical protein